MGSRGEFVKNTALAGAGLMMLPNLSFGDAAALSSITPLSEISIQNNGAPQEIPDFTRGMWVQR